MAKRRSSPRRKKPEMDRAKRGDATGSVLVDLELDESIETVRNRLPDIVRAVSGALEQDPSEFWVVALRRGCALVMFRVRPEVGARLRSEIGAVKRWLKKIGIRARAARELPERPPNAYSASDDAGGILNTSGRCVTWLHLSDLHLSASRRSGDDEAMAAFESDLRGELARFRLRPSLIFVTGDLARSGTRDDYEEVEAFLGRVKEMLEAKVLAVPGNHDVTWTSVAPPGEDDFETRLRGELTGQDSVERLLTSAEREDDRNKCLERQAEFLRFFRESSVLEPPHQDNGLFWIWSHPIDAFRVGIAGLNSAWRSTARKIDGRDTGLDDRGQLILGKWQLFRAMQSIRDADLRIALVHHPPRRPAFYQSWDLDAHEAQLRKADLVLKGHEHHPETVIGNPWGTPRLEIAAGALFGPTEDRWKGFNCGFVNFDTGMQGLVSWTYRRESGRWVVDAERDGIGERPVSSRIGQRIEAQSNQPAGER